MLRYSSILRVIYQEEFKTLITGLKKGLDKGKEKYGFKYNLIMCFLRHLTEAEAIDTLKEAVPFKKDILAVGLDSSKMYMKWREKKDLDVWHMQERKDLQSI